MLENYQVFVLFAVIMLGTPGPGNLSMLALGQTVGYRKTLPFLTGMVSGGILVNLLTAVGLGKLFAASPATAAILQVAGTGYILYLAWKILRMHVGTPGEARPFGFLQGAALHPLSPKTWAMSVSAFSQFADPAGSLTIQAALFVGTFFLGMVIFHSLWCLAGAGLLRLLRAPWLRVGVNAAMAASMVAATMYALYV